MASVLGTDMSIPRTTKELFADSAKRSTVAHLFHFYPLLCELASIPLRSPSYWVQSGTGGAPHSFSDRKFVIGQEDGGDASIHWQDSAVIEQDARHLAMECLKIIGREIGIST